MMRNPKKFYKYRGFDINTLDSLCYDNLYFAQPGTFNDPLDCNPTIECDSDLEELRHLLAILIQNRVKSEILSSLKDARVKGGGAIAHAEKRAILEAKGELANIAYNATDPDYAASQLETEARLLVGGLEGELRVHYDRGVCCFSTSYASPLLWSHYGDQHQGLCIGYSLARNPAPELSRVVYGGNRSIKTSVLARALLHGDPKAKTELDRDVLLRKARGWSYEKEWRLIGNQGNQNSPLLLEEVTFGLRCPTSVVHAVIQALAGRDKPVSYYQIYEVDGSFVLRRSAVNLDELGTYMPITAQSGIEIFGENNNG